MTSGMTEKQKFDHIISLMPEEMQKRFNAPDKRTLKQLKNAFFASQHIAEDGTIFGNYKKIGGKWHKVKKDGSLYTYGLDRPCKEMEQKYLESLPAYQAYMLGEAYFTGVETVENKKPSKNLKKRAENEITILKKKLETLTSAVCGNIEEIDFGSLVLKLHEIEEDCGNLRDLQGFVAQGLEA